jgi:hypothetical protein
MAVFARKSVVIKQSRGFYAAVGTVVSIFVDKSLCLLCGTTSSVTKDLKEIFKFVVCIFSGIIISTVFIRQGRRHRKLLDDLNERRGYSHLKEETLDRSMWRAGFGRGFGPVVKQTT